MVTAKRPTVIVNVAMSADGKIDTVARKGAAISSTEDKARVDTLRASVDAVLVGGRTLIHEDPRLTVKSPQLRRQRKADGRSENPVKVGVVSVANLKPGGAFLTAGPARKLIFTTRRSPPELVKRLERAGAEVFVAGEKAVNLKEILHSLRDLDIHTVMVEGGGTLIAEFLRQDLVDELYAYIAPRLFGGSTAPTPADGPGFLLAQAPHLELVSVERFDTAGGVLLHYKIQHTR
jgi:2,5-diamino-6-(ribosylamino)-4(3H)-pyrimidinone 5'-phosphate reductase